MINIQQVIAEENIFTGDAIGADYCHDECPGVTGTPDAAVEVTSTEQAAAVVKLCAEAGVPVTVRGAGTGQAGGSVPVEMDGERVGATLMLTLEGEDDDSVMEKMEEIAELAEEIECLDILVGDTPTMKREFWAAHDAFHTSMESGAKNAIEYNITIPADKIAEMVEYAKADGEAKGLKVMAYAHVGSGGMHIHAVSDGAKDEFAAKAAELAALIYGKCAELGGSIRGEYGIGCAKKQYLGTEALEKFGALKAKYDPKGILNPGKAAE